MSRQSVSPLPARCRPLIHQWARAWQAPNLAEHVTIEVSTRLRTTLGRCSPKLGHIRVAAFVLEAGPELLDEVLCHELAHAAVWRLHGAVSRAHGPEWSELMRAAGFLPRARLPAALLDALPLAAQEQRTVWEHRCPICDAKRRAGRSVPQWRCTTCRSAGRSGALLVTRRTGTAR